MFNERESKTMKLVQNHVRRAGRKPVRALSDSALPIRDRTYNMKLITSKHFGFTLVELMVVVSLVGLLATICLPSFLRSVAVSKRNECINNLRQLDSAVQQFVLENKRAASSPVTIDDCVPYMKNTVTCPAGGTTVHDSYSVTDGQTVPQCISTGGGAANGHLFAP